MKIDICCFDTLKSQYRAWFTSLVSKSDNVKPSIKLIKKLGATDSREIEMKQGNKISRILAWTFFKDKNAQLVASNT